MGTPWTGSFEQACRRDVVAVCDRDAARADRDRAWRALLTRIGPRIEDWAAGSPLLRQVGLGGEDDVRAVLVAVIERLAADDFANLRRFVERRAADTAVVDDLDYLGQIADTARDDDTEATPLRAWMLTLLKFVERDHVRARLGWAEGDKRGVATGADRLPTDGGPHGTRPPVSVALTLARIAAELRDAMTTFPDAMRSAIELWMTDVPFEEIATRLELADASAARGLVRAGQARLRERFRDQVPLLFGA